MVLSISDKNCNFYKYMLYEQNENGDKHIKQFNGKLYVNRVYKKMDITGKIKSITLDIDKEKSSKEFLDDLEYSHNFIGTMIALKGGSIKSCFNTENKLQIIISDNIPKTINLRKPYKISIDEFVGLSNFEIILTLNMYLTKTYLDNIIGLKFFSLTVQYNQAIYNKYNINKNLEIESTLNNGLECVNKEINAPIKITEYQKRKNIVSNIMNILHS